MMNRVDYKKLHLFEENEAFAFSVIEAKERRVILNKIRYFQDNYVPPLNITTKQLKQKLKHYENDNDDSDDSDDSNGSNNESDGRETFLFRQKQLQEQEQREQQEQ